MRINSLLIVTLFVCFIGGLLFSPTLSLAIDDDPVSPDGVLLPTGAESHYGTLEVIDTKRSIVSIDDQLYTYTGQTKCFDKQKRSIRISNLVSGDFILFYTLGGNGIFKIFVQEPPDGEEAVVDSPAQEAPSDGEEAIKLEDGVWTN